MTTAKADRLAWWRRAKFGMFVHWGLYAIPGRGEWVMNRENIPVAEYEKLAARFTPRHCDLRAWARLAKAAGMNYLVFTTKHHDGFCLWDSQLTGYTSAKTAAGRDFVAEYVAACRAEGLRIGFYFSLMDWHHPDSDGHGIIDPAARRRFVDYVHGQVRELCTRYGKIDVLWYDVPWPYDAEQWRSVELNAMVRALQPGILINNRSWTDEDFGTPEQCVKAEAAGRDWEACITLNDNWGYHRGDHNWKTAGQVIMTLADCARDGGNLLLNVGPDGDGVIPAESQRILREVGSWLERNGEAIYGTDRAEVGWGNWGKLTVKGRMLYLLVANWVGAELVVGRLKCQPVAARFVATGQSITFEALPHGVRLTGLPEAAPDFPVTVIAIEMDAVPKHASGPSCLNPVHNWSDPPVGVVEEVNPGATVK